MPNSHYFTNAPPWENPWYSSKAWMHPACFDRFYKSAVDQLPWVRTLWELSYTEYDEERPISSWQDSRKKIVSDVCRRAKELGKDQVTVTNLNGPFKSMFGGVIDSYGIAKKHLSLRNLDGEERKVADEIAGSGYSVYVSEYPFMLMIRL